MSNTTILMAVLLVASARGGCGPDNSSDNGSVVAGKVEGRATDSQGQPLSGARITICNPVYFDSCEVGATGADGRYSLDLQATNVWTASASITTQYNGKSYCLDLSPSSTATFTSADGAVRDFQWKLIGMRPDKSATDESMSYYGGALTVVDGSSNFLDLRSLEVTLVPEGPLVDGSAGQTITVSAGNWKWNDIGNIPLGRYTVTATYGATQSPMLVTTDAFGSYTPSATIDFAPLDGGVCGNPEARIFVIPAQ